MKRSKYTEQQIAFALKQAELGTPVEEVCRKMGIWRGRGNYLEGMDAGSNDFTRPSLLGKDEVCPSYFRVEFKSCGWA